VPASANLNTGEEKEENPRRDEDISLVEESSRQDRLVRKQRASGKSYPTFAPSCRVCGTEAERRIIAEIA
jgi:hypothetical protein